VSLAQATEANTGGRIWRGCRRRDRSEPDLRQDPCTSQQKRNTVRCLGQNNDSVYNIWIRDLQNTNRKWSKFEHKIRIRNKSIKIVVSVNEFTEHAFPLRSGFGASVTYTSNIHEYAILFLLTIRY
jgi:hypothetical protein